MQTRQLVASGGFLILMLSAPHLGLAQPGNDDLQQQRYERLQKEIESLKAGQKAILNELQEIKKLLRSRGEERSPIRDINLTLNIADAFARGDNKAMLTLVEFTDYQ